MTRKLNLDLVAEHYDDVFRLAGSLKFGRATAFLLGLQYTLADLASGAEDDGARRVPVLLCAGELVSRGS